MSAQQANEYTGLLGYVKDDIAKHLHARQHHSPTVDVNFERGSDKILMRVNVDDIVEVKPGPSEHGETLVHLILKHGSHVNTEIKAFRDIKAIKDPTLSRLTVSSAVSVSFV